MLSYNWGSISVSENCWWNLKTSLSIMSYHRLFVNTLQAVFRLWLRAASPTDLHVFWSVPFSSVPAIVVGVDKYLLFPAWQGNEWEGDWPIVSCAHCNGGVRDEWDPLFPAGTLKPQYTVSPALGQTRQQSVWGGGGEPARAQIGDTKKRALLKRRVETVPLWELFTWQTTSGTPTQ